MISVIKANGIKEPFIEEKLITSIRRAHVPRNVETEALLHIKRKLYDGISTDEIYRHILEFLDTTHPYAKSRYSLKEAIMLLGPTGYPFEDFVARILQHFGYRTKVRQILRGSCVTHEVDIIAEQNGKTCMIEAKFHNNPGLRSEIHVALYTHARFEDLRIRNSLDCAWIVTNTKTTIDANTYALCRGMKVISWNYPEGESLRDMIEQSTLHPITILTTLNQSQKEKLLENHIVLCKDIRQNASVLDILPISKEERERTLAEVAFICTTEK